METVSIFKILMLLMRCVLGTENSNNDSNQEMVRSYCEDDSHAPTIDSSSAYNNEEDDDSEDDDSEDDDSEDDDSENHDEDDKNEQDDNKMDVDDNTDSNITFNGNNDSDTEYCCDCSDCDWIRAHTEMTHNGLETRL